MQMVLTIFQIIYSNYINLYYIQHYKLYRGWSLEIDLYKVHEIFEMELNYQFYLQFMLAIVALSIIPISIQIVQVNKVIN